MRRANIRTLRDVGPRQRAVYTNEDQSTPVLHHHFNPMDKSTTSQHSTSHSHHHNPQATHHDFEQTFLPNTDFIPIQSQSDSATPKIRQSIQNPHHLNTSLLNASHLSQTSAHVTATQNISHITSPQLGEGGEVINRLVTLFGIHPSDVDDIFPVFAACGKIVKITSEQRLIIFEYHSVIEAREALKLHGLSHGQHIIAVKPTEYSELSPDYVSDLLQRHGPDALDSQYSPSHNNTLNMSMYSDDPVASEAQPLLNNSFVSATSHAMFNNSIHNITHHHTINATNDQIAIQSPHLRITGECTANNAFVCIAPFNIDRKPNKYNTQTKATYEEYLRNRGCLARFWDNIRGFCGYE